MDTVHQDEKAFATLAEPTAGWLKAVRTGEPRWAGGLEITPLLADLNGTRRWLLLHEAVAKGLLEVKERGAGATVNEVEAFNRGKLPVLVLEGESIVGAKQNRVVVETVLIAAQTLVTIPVGCVEQGRWARGTIKFEVGAMPVSPQLRKFTATEAARAGHINQAGLWGQVVGCLTMSKVGSPTADYHKLIEVHRREVEERARALEPVPGQVGIVATDDHSLVGLELVGHPEAWRAVAGRLVPSYLLWSAVPQWASESKWGRGGEKSRDGRAWLTAIAEARQSLRPTRGFGVRLVLEGDGFTGAGLWHEDRPAHLAVFSDEGR